MTEKNHHHPPGSRVGLVLGLPGLILLVALFYQPLGRLIGRYEFLLFDWCVLQIVAGLTALGMALFRRRRREIAWAVYFLLSAALPLIIVAIRLTSVAR